MLCESRNNHVLSIVYVSSKDWGELCENDTTGADEWHTSICSRTALLYSATEDLEQLGKGQKPDETVNLSAKMSELGTKNATFQARRFYHYAIKPNLPFIVPVVLFLSMAGLFFFKKRYGKKT